MSTTDSRVTLRLFVAVSIALMATTSLARPQAQTGVSQTFLIDPNRPFVYARFDHIGKGLQRNEDEPKVRIWLHLTNNCRVPIIVYASGVPDGSPKNEVGVWDDVVANPELFLVVASGAPVAPARIEGTESATQAKESKMPRGYVSEVGSTESIAPGESILFSVPVNHIGEKWHMEIPFAFDLPRGKGPRDPIVGGQPRMVLEYSLSDVPPDHLSELQR